MAQQLFPNEDPVGHTIGDKDLSPQSLRRIVGVVGNIREGALDDPILPAVYSAFNQNPSNYFFLVVRTAQNPSAMLPSLAAAIHQAAPAVGVRNEYTMAEHIADSGAAYTHSSSAWLVGSFAALALLLGVIGLYGVIAFSVSQRTREIGVRMALGAQRNAVYRLILVEAGWLVLIGLVLGSACSITAGILIRSLLFGVRSWDISIFVAVAVLLAVSALAACYIPARRAASIDPMQALRAE
jgi:ABC-type antimicrobial peptide transport system permease subunit